MFVAHPGFGVKDMKEALVRAREGKLHYGSPGAGTTPHLSAQFVFGSLANVSISHVAYKGMGPFITALTAGEIPLGAASLPAVLAQLRAGKMQGLAVTSARRAVAAPAIPTIAETGLNGFEVENWVAVWAPAGPPPDLLAKLGVDLERAATLPDTVERLAAIGFEPARVSRAELPAYVSRELAKWTRVVKETGAKAE